MGSVDDLINIALKNIENGSGETQKEKKKIEFLAKTGMMLGADKNQQDVKCTNTTIYRQKEKKPFLSRLFSMFIRKKSCARSRFD